MHYIWDVKLLDDSKIVDMGDKLKTDKFILSNKRSIWDNEELCKLIVRQNPDALKYVKINKSMELSLIGISISIGIGIGIGICSLFYKKK